MTDDECLQYHEIPEMTRQQIEKDISEGDDKTKMLALYSAAMYHDDVDWVQQMCFDFLRSGDYQLQYAALVSFGHVARIQGRLNLVQLVPILAELERDCPRLKEDVEFLRDEIEMFKPENCG